MDERGETDPWAETDKRDSMGAIPLSHALRASTSGVASSPRSTSATPLRPKINRETAAVITELGSRFPLSATDTPDTVYARLKLLMEDMATVDPVVLRAACQAAALDVKFLPTAGELMTYVRAEYDNRRNASGKTPEERNQDAVTAANRKLAGEGSPLRWSAVGAGPWSLDTTRQPTATLA